MDLTISRPVRIFALVALIAALGVVGLLALKPKSDATPPVIVRSATTVASSATTPPAKTSAPKPPAITSAAKPKRATSVPAPTAAKPATAKPKVAALVAPNGLPTVLVRALRQHRIVVVSVFDPQSQTDAISYAEARAGAAAVGAGFVGISVLDSVTAGALTTVLPSGSLLPTPGVLIYRRPDSLVYRIDGFADRDTIAQATVASAAAAPLAGS